MKLSVTHFTKVGFSSVSAAEPQHRYAVKSLFFGGLKPDLRTNMYIDSSLRFGMMHRKCLRMTPSIGEVCSEDLFNFCGLVNPTCIADASV